MHGLLISGGSDRHGTRKTIAAGTLNAFGAEVGSTADNSYGAGEENDEK